MSETKREKRSESVLRRLSVLNMGLFIVVFTYLSLARHNGQYFGFAYLVQSSPAYTWGTAIAILAFGLTWWGLSRGRGGALSCLLVIPLGLIWYDAYFSLQALIGVSQPFTWSHGLC